MHQRRSDSRHLDHAFNPRRIAVVGVSSDRAKWSNILFRRLLAGPFPGEVVPVNPARDRIEGRPCHASLREVPGQIDYAKILVPRTMTEGALRDCSARGIPVAHVLSSGFGEVGTEGQAYEARLRAVLADSNTAMIGPNSLGLYSARAGLDFSEGCHFTPGPITFISQSGALCTDILAQGQARGLAFSKILSVGNCTDLDWPDYVRYCRTDPDTGIAAFYVEGVRDGQALFRELQALAAEKPVLMIKGGRTERGARGVMSHTGRLAGQYAVWKAMMAQAGVMEMRDLDDLLAALVAFDAHLRRPARGGPMVIGCGGGISVLISDALEEAGVPIAPLGDETVSALHRLVPDAGELGGIGNPVEMPVDRIFGDPDRLGTLVRVAASDTTVGAILVHLNLIAVSNQFGADNLDHVDVIAAALNDISRETGKPLAVFLRNATIGAETTALGRRATARLSAAEGVVLFHEQSSVVEFLSRLRQFQENVR